MRRWMTAALLLSLPVLALTADDTPKPKPQPKQKIVTADAAKAGPDFAIQGEYVVEHNGHKVGVQVIALGDGKFTVRGLKDGLPGDGWDGESVKQGEGKTENGKVTFDVEGVTGTISGGTITANTPDGEISGKKVTRKSPTEGMKPPAGAVVLFDGKSLDGWAKRENKSPATWTLIEGEGVMQVKGGDIVSKQKLGGSFTLHVEFRLPFMPNDRGQGRANSGVYLQNRYELQVLDSFGLKGLNNEAGGFYQAHDPKVNMCYPPLQWQTYDVEFTAAKYENGQKVKNARATVKHNGVVVQDDVELKQPSGGGEPESDSPDGIRLQDHGNPVQFRNIWAVEKK